MASNSAPSSQNSSQSSPQNLPKKPLFLNRPLRLAILLGSIPLFLILVFSAAITRQNTANRVIDWLPDGIEETKLFADYYQHFHEGELLMASWTGCHISDKTLDAVAERLSSPQAEGSPPYFDRVMTTRSILAQLKEPPLDLSTAEAKSRLAGWLIGRNGTDACLVAMISEDAGNQKRKEAIDAVFQIISEETNLGRDDIFVAGPTIDSIVIDDISRYSQRMLLPFFLGLCFLLLFCCLRNFYVAGLVFAVALMNEELGGALLFWTGTHADSISMLITSLVYVLTISGGMHLVNYYRETLSQYSLEDAPRQTLKKAVLPCTLAVVTTILGFISLGCSAMIPIRTFGIFASVALTLGIIWLFLFLMSALQEYPTPKIRPTTSGRSKRRSSYFWHIFARFVRRFRNPIILLTAISSLFFSVGLAFLNTTVTFHGMLPQDNKAIRDYAYLEEKIGGLIPIEIVLRVPQQANVSMLDQVFLLQTMRTALVGTNGLESVVSALNFLPSLPGKNDGSVRATSRRAAINSLLNRRIEIFEDTRLFDRDAAAGPEAANSNPTHFWRMSLRVPSGGKVHYGDLVADIRARFESLHLSKIILGADFYVTGAVPLVHQAQNLLLKDLIESFIMAFGLIALTLMIMLRGILRGLVAMIPNLFPCVLVFGFLGWSGMPVDMGSMMTASVAMGIAVDATLHFFTWFRIALKQGKKRHQAIFFAYRSCATALLQTTIICGLGMLVFGLSGFVPVARFAILLCILLFTALVGTIVVLPAILMSPVGRLFETRGAR